jgi:hypothetical protein
MIFHINITIVIIIFFVRISCVSHLQESAERAAPRGTGVWMQRENLLSSCVPPVVFDHHA